ncbi:MAG: GntR family transcriptional regulator [Xanthobacteraceae bacterium]|uniref:GntR family transcriptional regulator n=1 Tax=Pseudolabrys sp. TaxID=1960880 RepID=UPI003D0B1526
MNEKLASRPTTTAAWILENLRSAILQGSIPAHSLVRQDDIAATYGVSRMPVREAIRSLEAEGLVIARPNRGSFVAPLDPDDAAEIFDIRASLEALALRRSIPAMDDTKKKAAADALAALEQAQAKPDASSDLHRDFHLSLYAGAGSRLLRLIGQHIDAAERYLRLEATLVGTMDEDRYEHRALLEATITGDVRGATRLIERHVAGTGLEIAELLRARALQSPAPLDE